MSVDLKSKNNSNAKKGRDIFSHLGVRSRKLFGKPFVPQPLKESDTTYIGM